MSTLIPLTSDGARRVTVTLRDIGLITFRTRYNPASDLWYLDLFEIGQPLVLGLAIVRDHNLLRNFPNLTARFGQLRVIDIGGGLEAERLGVSLGVVHFKPGELENKKVDNVFDFNIDAYFSTITKRLRGFSDGFSKGFARVRYVN